MSEAWSCRSGDWFGIFGEHAAVLLPPAEKSRAVAVWELVDDGAGFDETLDALISSGLRDLAGFVLVSRAGDETRVVLRGEAHAHLVTSDGEVHVDGDRSTTWVERTLSGVVRVSVEVSDGHDDDRRLVLAHALARVSSAEWTGADADAQAVADAETDADHDADHDGQTRAGAATAARALPGIPGQLPAPAVTARPVARLVLSTGETVDVDRTVVVGRAPETSAADHEGTRLVRVPSPQQEISSVHLEV
ncbi:MAG: hypothetical protein WBP61_17215, partial [Nocardioides sp.]